MPASRCNFLVVYKGDSQVYAAASKEVALSSPPPEGVRLEDKRVLFISYMPDLETLSARPVPQEEVLTAELQAHKKKNKDPS